MQDIFIGVYGTSSKTEVRIERTSGELIGESEVEEANIHLSVKHAWDAIIRGIYAILTSTNISFSDPQYTFHIGLGLKYTELVEVCLAFEKAAPDYIKSIILKSDGYVQCLGTHKNKGSIIIIDEGIVGNALNDNNWYKVGGWGFPHADVGSYPWIGLEAIRLTLQWLDGYIESTKLIEAIYEYFDNDPYKIVRWSMQNRQHPDKYLAIYKVVLHYLRYDDPYAVLLSKKTAAEVDTIYSKLQQKTGYRELPCALYSLMVPYFEAFLGDEIKRNLTVPNGSGLTGAIKMIRGKK